MKRVVLKSNLKFKVVYEFKRIPALNQGLLIKAVEFAFFASLGLDMPQE